MSQMQLFHLYDVLVDVSETWEENDIGVISIPVAASDAETARATAIKEIDDGKHDDLIEGKQVYVWSVSEEDKAS